jgi:hypothetical protein
MSSVPKLVLNSGPHFRIPRNQSINNSRVFQTSHGWRSQDFWVNVSSESSKRWDICDQRPKSNSEGVMYKEMITLTPWWTLCPMSPWGPACWRC